MKANHNPTVTTLIGFQAVTNIVKRTFESKSQLKSYSSEVVEGCDKYCKKNF